MSGLRLNSCEFSYGFRLLDGEAIHSGQEKTTAVDLRWRFSISTAAAWLL